FEPPPRGSRDAAHRHMRRVGDARARPPLRPRRLGRPEGPIRTPVEHHRRRRPRDARTARVRVLETMTVTRGICLLLVVAAAPLAGAHARAQAGASPALAIIVHPSNPVENLTFSELRRIFMLDTQT